MTALGAFYSRGEILYLMSISEEDAIKTDAYGADSLLRFGQGESSGSSSSSSDHELPVLVRRADVQRAQRASEPTQPGTAAILAVRGAGVTEREIAAPLGVSSVRIHQRVHRSVEEIIDELGGPGDDDGAFSRPARCWRQGCENLKHLVPAVHVKTRRGRQTIKAARQLNLCEAHAAAVAHRLEQDGMAPLDIAARMNLSFRTIRGWLTDADA